VLPLESLSLDSLAEVGGKNAALGEMLSQLGGVGVAVPGGFATTATAYRLLLEQPAPEGSGSLRDQLLAVLSGLDVDDLEALQHAGAAARALVLRTALPNSLVQ